MTEIAADQRETQPTDLTLMESLRAVWRECMMRVRRGAAPEEWEAITARVAELERRLSLTKSGRGGRRLDPAGVEADRGA